MLRKYMKFFTKQKTAMTSSASPLSTPSSSLSSSLSSSSLSSPSSTPSTSSSSLSFTNEINVIVKWNGNEYEIGPLRETDTVQSMKQAIHAKTKVKPERQKLLNLKHEQKLAENEQMLGTIKFPANFKIMMMGSLEADIEAVNAVPESSKNVVNDLRTREPHETQTERKDVYLAKIQSRVERYKIVELNKPRDGKNLLVLDIDHTLFDNSSTAETGAELMRPFLHEFLTESYANYDLVIWSATGMRWIVEKMKILGVDSNTNYKILFYLDCMAMISVHTKKYGLVQVKPLGVIWGIYKQFSEKNTLIIDDLRRNFLMNPRNGLKIEAYRHAHRNRATDRELFHLIGYLKFLANKSKDFSTVKHRKWKNILRKYESHASM